MQERIKQLNRVAQAIYDKKGSNIFGVDIHEVSPMTDYVLIAEGTVDRHVKALADTVVEKLALEGLHPFHIEGDREGDWIVLDYLDFMVHLFIPDLREKYALERMWPQGKIIDLKFDISEPRVEPWIKKNES